MNTIVQDIIAKMQEAKENFPKIGFDDEFIRGLNKGFQMSIFITETLNSENLKSNSNRSYTTKEVVDLFEKLETQRGQFHLEDANELVPLDVFLSENGLTHKNK